MSRREDKLTKVNVWGLVSPELISWCWSDVGAEIDCPCGATIIIDDLVDSYICDCGREYRCCSLFQVKQKVTFL